MSEKKKYFEMTDDERLDNLKERVNQYNSLQLPGQAMSMHMGTAYLIGDLWTMLQNLKAND